jgi:hypothetical protein
MTDKPKIDLGDYTEVKDRIAIFYERYAQGRLVTEEVRATREPDDVPRIWVKAAAYRTSDDPKPGIGWSWLELPGSTSFTRGSELENAETSAWGRAIGSLGILIERSIASSNEIASKAAPAAPRPAAPAAPPAATSVARPVAPRPVAAPRPADPNEPPEISDAELDSLAGIMGPPPQQQAPQAAPHAVGETCPKHNVPWLGTPGDLYHKSDQGYCRPDGQPRKAR